MEITTAKQTELSQRDKKKLLEPYHRLCWIQYSQDFERLRGIMADAEKLLEKYRD